jgi:hypothetical protein
MILSLSFPTYQIEGNEVGAAGILVVEESVIVLDEGLPDLLELYTKIRHAERFQSGLR